MAFKKNSPGCGCGCTVTTCSRRIVCRWAGSSCSDDVKPASVTVTMPDGSSVTQDWPAASTALGFDVVQAGSYAVTATQPGGATQTASVSFDCSSTEATLKSVTFHPTSFHIDFTVGSSCEPDITVTVEVSGAYSGSCTTSAGSCRITIVGDPLSPSGPTTITVSADKHTTYTQVVPGTLACGYTVILDPDSNHACCYNTVVSACWKVTTPIGSFVQTASGQGAYLYSPGPSVRPDNPYPTCTCPLDADGQCTLQESGAAYAVAAVTCSSITLSPAGGSVIHSTASFPTCDDAYAYDAGDPTGDHCPTSTNSLGCSLGGTVNHNGPLPWSESFTSIYLHEQYLSGTYSLEEVPCDGAAMMMPPAAEAGGPPGPGPGLFTMAANLAGSLARHIADGARLAPPEVQAERKAACQACPLWDRARDRCSKCGCTAMDVKRSWASSACPDDPPRWGAV